ncbi:uncharacterized protein LOC119686078 isoform X2 [Teleopsis dalmanni]|uniref:uncharacterized protein LOC119686078 isoform X2 n=1 Tax=Teleopsis dalmanni TaxID=139649 RepID=UPI0018CDC315|nr:uncharacterized protein LOC119686078 isoform X2 [Teleopsis dalmanni]
MFRFFTRKKNSKSADKPTTQTTSGENLEAPQPALNATTSNTSGISTVTLQNADDNYNKFVSIDKETIDDLIANKSALARAEALLRPSTNDEQASTSAAASLAENYNRFGFQPPEHRASLAQTASNLAASMSEQFSHYSENNSLSEHIFESDTAPCKEDFLKRAYQTTNKDVPSTSVTNVNDEIASTSRNERADRQSGKNIGNPYSTLKHNTTLSKKFNNDSTDNTETITESRNSGTDASHQGYSEVNYRQSKKIQKGKRPSFFRYSLNLGTNKGTSPAKVTRSTDVTHIDNETLSRVTKSNYIVKAAKTSAWSTKLGNLFMARGRNNHSRNKSVHNQTKVQQLQNQQQQLPHSKQQHQHRALESNSELSAGNKNVPSEFLIHNRAVNSPALYETLMNRFDNNKSLTTKQTTAKHLEQTTDPLRQQADDRNRSQNSTHIFSADTFRSDVVNGERTQRAHSADIVGMQSKRARSSSADECKTDDELYTGRAQSAKFLEERHNSFTTQVPNINSSAFTTDTVSTAENNTERVGIEHECDRSGEREQQRDCGFAEVATSEKASIGCDYSEFDKCAHLTQNGVNGINQTAEVKLAACERDNLWQSSVARETRNIEPQDSTPGDNLRTYASMGQANAKINETAPTITRNSAAREFRESVIPKEDNSDVTDKPKIVLPTITVVDCSGDSNGEVGDCIAQPVIYNGTDTSYDSVKITPIEEVLESILSETASIVTNQNQNSPYPLHTSARHINIKLAEVPEEYEDAEDLGSEISRQHYDVPEQHNLVKSENASDSNLSTGCPDSGFVDGAQAKAGSSDREAFAQRAATSNTSGHHLPFVRDGNSTDCDELLMPNEEYDYLDNVDDGGVTNVAERLVCIESISLPDVVESTASSLLQANGASSSGSSTTEEQIVNINGATGNSIGKVHFVPIHVEGSSEPIKRRSVDDSCIGSGGIRMGEEPTIEIIEEGGDTNYAKSNKFGNFGKDLLAEKYKIENSQLHEKLEVTQLNVNNLQTKISELQNRVGNLDSELSAKTWNVERLQGELSAAHKDDEFVRKKLKLLEDEKVGLRQKFDEREDQYQYRIRELEEKHTELMEKFKQTKTLASNLQTQFAAAQSDAEEWRQEVIKIRAELEEQISALNNALKISRNERRICEDRWQTEFEIMRTQNRDREETLMEDCEWKIRQTQGTCKEKLEKSESARREALQKVEELENDLAARDEQLETLKTFEAEVRSLRGVVGEQEQSIQALITQLERLTTELTETKENLKEEIHARSQLKYQCDNTIRDKERQLNYRIDEIRHEAASFWETKLHTEMTRLKNELESVYADDRREALDKIQEEHVEELRALTTRYTAIEEELRAELAETEATLERKKEEYLELRDRSDNALLQTRMHLDRADREYQNAMCREEERRETLEANLRKEFEEKKQEMEEDFLERLKQVQEEFSVELQYTKQELTDLHQGELIKEKAKLKAEKDEALLELADRHKKKLLAADERLSISYDNCASLFITALSVLAKGACPYIPSLYVLYMTMSPLISLACLVFNIVAIIYLKYGYLIHKK